jgi:hypothetical protein
MPATLPPENWTCKSKKSWGARMRQRAGRTKTSSEVSRADTARTFAGTLAVTFSSPEEEL